MSELRRSPRRQIARTGLLAFTLALIATPLFGQAPFVPPNPPPDYVPVSVGECKEAQQPIGVPLSTTSTAGIVDPNWIVTGPTGTLKPGHTAIPGQWNALPNNWVQPYPPSPTAFQTAPGKPSRFTYTIWFDLPCAVDSYKNLVIQGTFAADNNGTVYLNATPHGTCTGCFSNPINATQFTITSGFQQGLNSLSVVVDNIDDNSPTGASVIARLTGICVGVCKAPTAGILKVCKVAGTGITVGTPFNFTVSTSTSHGTLSVPAGPAPGGTCMIGPSYSVGTQVDVTEAPMTGVTVSSITVAVGPPGHVVNTNLPGRGVSVVIGNGVTEVTFTDQRTGYLEICKQGDVKGPFSFMVNPGNLGPFTVPAGACSPAIEVAAGTVTISEQTPGYDIVACSTIPPSAQQPICNKPPNSQNSVVTVVPGDISTMTIAFVTNRPKGPPPQ